MENRLLHDLLDDKAIWQKFTFALKAKRVNPHAIPYFVRGVQIFLSKAENTSVTNLTPQRVTSYLLYLSMG
jgi:hypothetical protein